jgi:hypothetical protein
MPEVLPLSGIRPGLTMAGPGQITFPPQRPCYRLKDVHADV